MIDASGDGDRSLDLHGGGEEGQGSVGEGNSGGDQASTSRKVIAKFLVSNSAAGSIIGRSGSNISQLQQQSGARLQLSRNQEYFPGTQERIMIATGTVNQILTALHLVLTKIQSEQASDTRGSLDLLPHTIRRSGLPLVKQQG
jgi:RNA-binding protein Nova